MRYILTALLVASSAHANEPPPIPEGGINYVMQGECQDNETGLTGYCYGGYDNKGNFYLTFWLDNQLQFIRKVVENQPYETICVNDTYNSF